MMQREHLWRWGRATSGRAGPWQGQDPACHCGRRWGRVGFPCEQVGTLGETYLFGIYHTPERTSLCLS